MWAEIYDKLAGLPALAHRSTLVFVNTRSFVEKIAFALTERLEPTLGPDCVAAHHGSLSRELRLDAEQRLKNGEIRILVATASLELGIDIGSVDLVCQIASTRAVAVAMQRVGRAGHWRGAIPKGRLFASTRDDLLRAKAPRSSAKMRAGELDQLEIPPQPTDVLMQQIVAPPSAAEPWDETDLFNVLRRAYPYRNLTRALFDDVIKLLSEGIESSRGRYGAYLLRDGVHGQLHPRRGSRSIAISNGGAIPDTCPFQVSYCNRKERTNCHPRRALRRRADRSSRATSSSSATPVGASSASKPLAASSSKTPTARHPPCPSGSARPHCAPQSSRTASPTSANKSPPVPPTSRPHRSTPLIREVAACAAWLQRRVRSSVPLPRTSSSPTSSPAARRPRGRSLQDDHHRRAFLLHEGGGQQLILHAPFRRPHQQGMGTRPAQALLPRLQLRAASRRHRQRHQHLAHRAAQLPALRCFPLPHRAHRQGTARAGRHSRAGLQDALALGRQPLTAVATHVQGQTHRAADPAHSFGRPPRQRLPPGRRLLRNHRR